MSRRIAVERRLRRWRYGPGTVKLDYRCGVSTWPAGGCIPGLAYTARRVALRRMRCWPTCAGSRG